MAAGGTFYLVHDHALTALMPGGTGNNPQPAALVRPALSPCPDAGPAVTGGGSGAPPQLGTCPQASSAAVFVKASRPAASHIASPASPAARQVLAVVNQARAQAGLPPYTMISGLNASAAGHSQAMAAGCGLSHQCPGEPSLGARETAAGVQWTTAGENIAEGGPESANAAAIASMAITLTQDMLDEHAPNDGHRRNMLSTAFHHIGIAVIRDSHGNVWLTEDFSG